MTDNKKPRSPTDKVEKDATGQFAGTRHGGENSGVSSAKPRVITHSDDATSHNAPAGTEHSPKQRTRQEDLACRQTLASPAAGTEPLPAVAVGPDGCTRPFT